MTEIVLVRHGETDWNSVDRLQGRNDIPLNASGIAQAQAVAQLLADQVWDHIYSSPLQRAYRTAVEIAQALGRSADDIIVDERLRERSYGDAEGLLPEERDRRWPDHAWPNAETKAQIDARVLPAMLDIAGSNPDSRILLVGHGSWIRSALRVVSNYDPEIMSIMISNTSLTHVYYESAGWRVGDINIRPHLELD